ncbi:hypothetical protein [Magnetospirillum fulvum]|uniref:PEP-CTERM protein-sorting domain-containing protein n=1 Tax=Magnetospirillum fulvum TaxID=1082 RepID=A0A1H6HC78_MAGFU|nr:hypothetical protein [Magnetospirillum fulvum]SEH32712.1 hypothetical protein SAMN04244559_01302 [Magnetospirillum fulvum]
MRNPFSCLRLSAAALVVAMVTALSGTAQAVTINFAELSLGGDGFQSTFDGSLSTSAGIYLLTSSNVFVDDLGVSFPAVDGALPYNLGAVNTFDAVYTFTLPFSANTSVAIQFNTNELQITNVSLKSGTTSIGLSNSSGTGDITLAAANLLGGTYSLYYTVTAGPGFNGADGASFSGTVSAVPLPGAALLFGSSLLGLGFIGRRRQRNIARGAARVGGLGVLAIVLMIGLSASAKAASFSDVLILNQGNTLPDSTTLLKFAGTVGPNASSISGRYVSDIFTSTKQGTVTKSTGGSTTSFDLKFKLAQTSNLVVTLTDNISGSVTNGLIYDTILLNGIAGTILSSPNPNNTLVVSFSNLVANTLYDLVVTAANNTLIRNVQVSAAVSPVPIPGAVVLFGSALLGLGAYGRFNRAKKVG